MTQSVAPDQEDVFVTVRMITDADGIPAKAVVASTGGHKIWYRRDNAVEVDDATAAADMSLLTDAHVDWEFLHVREGYYTVAVPDAAFVKGVGNVLVGMEATGISCVAESVKIDKFLKFQGKADSVTATTTTFPAGTTPYQGDQIYVIDGTGERQTRLITSATGEVAVHAAWDVNISATTSTIVLIPGDETLGDGGINADIVASTRSTVTTAEVKSECDQALIDGAVSTVTVAQVNAECDTAIADASLALAAQLPAALSVGGRIVSAVEVVNGRIVSGTGGAGDEWGDGGAET